KASCARCSQAGTGMLFPESLGEGMFNAVAIRGSLAAENARAATATIIGDPDQDRIRPRPRWDREIQGAQDSCRLHFPMLLSAASTTLRNSRVVSHCASTRAARQWRAHPGI